jgi:membrane-bound lytic murein transglycosylase B
MLPALDLLTSSFARAFVLALVYAMVWPGSRSQALLHAIGADRGESAAQAPPADSGQPFADWLDDFVEEARGRGYSLDLLARTVAGLEPLPRVVAADRTQAELTTTFEQYLATRITTPMARRGLELAGQHRAVLGGIERAYSVQRRFLLAIWGLETRYGRNTGRTPIFRALATLAWEPRRAPFFRGQLYDALTIVANGYIDSGSMTGSWAGAMGHPQFMPSSYLRYAVDQDGDGRRDIWGSSADALASIANYLKGWGWNGDETWGREVRVTGGSRERISESVPLRTEGCFAMRDMTERIPLAEWDRLGVRLADGRSLPRADLTAALVETEDRTFLVYPNYDAILRYNCAHHYALSVALLSDRLR